MSQVWTPVPIVGGVAQAGNRNRANPRQANDKTTMPPPSRTNFGFLSFDAPTYNWPFLNISVIFRAASRVPSVEGLQVDARRSSVQVRLKASRRPWWWTWRAMWLSSCPPHCRPVSAIACGSTPFRTSIDAASTYRRPTPWLPSPSISTNSPNPITSINNNSNPIPVLCRIKRYVTCWSCILLRFSFYRTLNPEHIDQSLISYCSYHAI